MNSQLYLCMKKKGKKTFTIIYYEVLFFQNELIYLDIFLFHRTFKAVNECYQ